METASCRRRTILPGLMMAAAFLRFVAFTRLDGESGIKSSSHSAAAAVAAVSAMSFDNDLRFSLICFDHQLNNNKMIK